MPISFLKSKTLLTAAMCLCLPLGSLAVDLSATEISSIAGRVEVKKVADNLFKKLHSNLKLAGSLKRLDSGDKVRTYAQSSAEMALKDTCILAVKEQSIFEVPKTLGQAAMTELKAQQGAILFKVISGSNFQVQTADVIAGVKGTLFELDIIDGFHCLLETPGLQIGNLAPGGTSVNVYKGEVELTHKQSGKKRSLKAGEGIGALGDSLRKLDSLLQDGFTPLRKFDPATLLSEKFGGGALGLLSADDSLADLTNLPALENLNSALGVNRISDMCGNVTGKLNEYIGGLKEGIEMGEDLIGKKYKADFSRFTPETDTITVADNRYREVYLGNRAFVACKAAAGTRLAKFEPDSEGIQLTEGNSMAKVVKFANASKSVEFLASFLKNGQQFITTVKVIKGDLYGRIPGNLEHFKIPAGEMSFVYDVTSGKGNWEKANEGSIDSELGNYKLEIEKEIAKEKGENDKENTRKKVKVLRNFLNF